MIIQIEHIREAEILFINGNRFDIEERVPFIKNLNSCDLLAVPGSGKTTALLAKLYCISKHLPFNDGSGILVLSHTNAAVDEIENSLKKHCPNLFSYPNFIGTIQSFVNRFIANIACYEKYGSYIRQNENEFVSDFITRKILVNRNSKIYGFINNLIKSKYNELKPDFLIQKGVQTPEELLLKYKELLIINNKCELQNIKDNYSKIISLPPVEKQIIFDFNNFLKSKTNDSSEYKRIIEEIVYDERNDCFYSDYFPSSWKKKLKTDTISGAELKSIMEELRENGILGYIDSFLLANIQLTKHPELKILLQKRFKFIFIDEMQDLEKFQIDIIDNIFYEERSTSIIQRIGDINQSIYSSGKKVKVEADWVPRNQMYLKGSNRLTHEIASIVNFFTLDRQTDEDGNPRFVVKGLRQTGNVIKPHMILFSNDSMGRLEGKFRELISNYSLQATREGQKYGYKIIGWNAKWDDDEDHAGKLRLENIFESYKKEAKSYRETYDSLSKYLQLFDHEKRTLEAARKALLNALIHVLRLEGKTYQANIRGKEVSRYYSKDELIKYIKNPENDCDYEIFKKTIYACSFRLIVKSEYELVYNKLKDFILNKLKIWFNLTITEETKSFLGDHFESIIVQSACETSEISSDNGINIEIGTVHSAKGQTHCATMYVETAYQRPIYESNKVIKVNSNPFLLQEHECNGSYDRQALKMMYVGFSRPTHLLCFAALKENIGNDFQPYIDAGWEIIDLTS